MQRLALIVLCASEDKQNHSIVEGIKMAGVEIEKTKRFLTLKLSTFINNLIPLSVKWLR